MNVIGFQSICLHLSMSFFSLYLIYPGCKSFQLYNTSIPVLYALTTLLKKIKGSDVLDFDCTIFFSEQDNANHFLLISSFSLKTVKFRNRQNNLFFTKDVWAFPLKAFFSIGHTGFLEDRRCHYFISSSSFIRFDKNMNKRLGENELFNQRTRKTNF